MRRATCPTCQSVFTTSHHSKRFCGSECRRVHRRHYEREYRALNIDRRRYNEVLRRYGLSPEQFDALVQAQNGTCAICGCRNDSDRVLAVDHCHTTGQVRGLLCDRCNVGVGMFLDEPDILLSAASYVASRRAHNPQVVGHKVANLLTVKHPHGIDCPVTGA